MAMSDAERQARRRAKLKAGEQPVIRYRKPADRRRRPQQWADACQALTDDTRQLPGLEGSHAGQPGRQHDSPAHR